jgi:serine/threonine protein kinase
VPTFWIPGHLSSCRSLKMGTPKSTSLRNPNCNRLELVIDTPHCRSSMFLIRLQIHHVSLGLTYLHSQNVIHGDLKAVNILIDDGPKALLSDFGLSMIKANSNSRLTKHVDIPQGSLYWMAPELFEGKRMRLPCDIYAFGMTMFEVGSALSRWHLLILTFAPACYRRNSLVRCSTTHHGQRACKEGNTSRASGRLRSTTFDK